MWSYGLEEHDDRGSMRYGLEEHDDSGAMRPGGASSVLALVVCFVAVVWS